MKFPDTKIPETKASHRARFVMGGQISPELIIRQPDMGFLDIPQKTFRGDVLPIRTYIVRDSFEKVILPEIDLVRKELIFRHIHDQDELCIDGNEYEIRCGNTATESDWWLE